MEYYLGVRGKQLMQQLGWISVGIMLSEKSQSEEVTYYMILFI